NGGDAEEEEVEEEEPVYSSHLVVDLLSYVVGCAFGRWDVRIGLDPSLAPALADPFAPLPVCSPGTLVGPDALPARPNRIASEEWMRARPDAITLPPDGAVSNPTISDGQYPLPIPWEGILVDDPDHQDDLVRQVRSVFDLLFGERSEAIEQEACQILEVKELRDYFRNPRGFFDYHIRAYSKSRRKAPIYWLLQSSRRSYGLWLYYHRLDPDVFFKALVNYVEPKLRLEESRLAGLRAERAQAGIAGASARQLERAIERQEGLILELHDFHDRLERAANLHLSPDLDDGVVLNIAPLWELVPWKVAKEYWQELLAGKYEWSSVSKQLRSRGVI
ncbi:MAG: BREX-1 system adenine-specific DNA-methyltransferase PglX, partial [Actinobacteria bacterium]|nr:BREX-1 system adenine-specific DNA-methyltransferase PglX [Actinomycetota bacterium]